MARVQNEGHSPCSSPQLSFRLQRSQWSVIDVTSVLFPKKHRRVVRSVPVHRHLLEAWHCKGVGFSWICRLLGVALTYPVELVRSPPPPHQQTHTHTPLLLGLVPPYQEGVGVGSYPHFQQALSSRKNFRVGPTPTPASKMWKASGRARVHKFIVETFTYLVCTWCER